ncbi:N-(5'-phosphoribosyl)anthranilate isomerase [Erysipelotrichaceae bacterium MTC7]|nr:N-(5'-phosphoribosyl)anthranilate isomerase [Erysipelotrichaceae bacterium MTC7]
MKAIKICGLQRKEDMYIINRFPITHIGFVFAPSKRQVSFEQASLLKGMLRPSIQAVGVFVDEKVELIEKLVHHKVIDMVQLHGKEDENYIKELKQRIKVPIIKAICIDQVVDQHLHYDVDYYLLDAKHPGSGKQFDWSLIPKLDKPTFLAGGICKDNIEQAIALCDYGVDISSGVESCGCKDKEKIKEIMEKCI